METNTLIARNKGMEVKLSSYWGSQGQGLGIRVSGCRV